MTSFCMKVIAEAETNWFAGHVSLQLVHLRMEHQVNRFMGCDYNIETPLDVRADPNRVAVGARWLATM